MRTVLFSLLVRMPFGPQQSASLATWADAVSLGVSMELVFDFSVAGGKRGMTKPRHAGRDGVNAKTSQNAEKAFQPNLVTEFQFPELLFVFRKDQDLFLLLSNQSSF